MRHKVRTITRDGEPWFVLADICAVLEIAHAPSAAQRLDSDEKATVAINHSGPNPNVTIINESGLWSLVLTSRKPEAKAFKKWLTAEVIPSLRKNGGYIVGQERMTDTERLAEALLIAQRINLDERAKREAAEARLESVSLSPVLSWE